ncbi:hypothetical protein QJS04_geneDACA012663 [Acorus gramineus]|uniref:Uncharacterized protein n=1 Tax=Acorus gramineus TaxID=55184 RepID=A0AAV9B736_ACOGR|nr:hypothetical protein QJS04_geneDACA012663 [Acorus gramineus]
MESLDSETIRSQVREVSEMLIDTSKASIPMSEEVLEAFVADFQRRRDQFESECPDFAAFGPEDLDAFLKKEAEELNLADEEAMELSNEIEALKRTVVQDSAMLMKELEELDNLLKSIDAGASTDLQFSICNDGSISVKNEESMIDKSEGNSKIWQADQCSEEAGIILSSLRELDCHLKREEAISQIEDILSHVKVIEYKGNCIRLALKTSINPSEGLWFRRKPDGIIWPLSIDHELLIEVVDGKTEMINVEIFPNDVSISTVVDAVKSSRHFPSILSTPIAGSLLVWLVRSIQQRILLSSLRTLIVEEASKSRHSFEYSDRDEIITAHLKGGIKVLIKVCQGWPVSTSPLKLVSVKNSDIYAKDISLSCLSKLEEFADSLDVQKRHHLPSFVDAIEELLAHQNQLDLH